MISIKNLKFNYDEKNIFNKLNLTIKDKKITSIIGQNGSGKSTLVKILVGLFDYSGTIKIDDLELTKENINEIRKIVGVVFENPDTQFVGETVLDDIIFTLENMNVNKNEMKKRLKEITELLKIDDILSFSPQDLNINQKHLVALASALVIKPKILILDEALTMLDNNSKDEIFKILKKLNKQGLTIINITHDIEETLISDEIIVLKDGKVLLKGNKEKVYKEEDKLKGLGFKLPFMVELSNRLIFYDLIDHFVYDMKEMVNLLWK